MSYKLKQDSIDVFSKEVSAKICGEFFMENEKIDGNQLMSITGSKQTNLLLVKMLFDKWQLEMAKLESPYFAFEEEEVKTALGAFMKILSKHIQVARTDFEPILSNALIASITLHFDSKMFYQNDLVPEQESDLSVQSLNDLNKYLKFNAAPFFNLLKDIKVEKISSEELKTQIESAYSNAELKEMDAHDFLKELGVLDKIDSLFDKETEVIEEVEIVKEVPVVQPKAKPSKIKLIADEDEELPGLNHKFEKQTATLVDTLNKKAKKDLESSLNLNDKFMFINNLFGGNKSDFKNVLKDLESSDNYSDAKSKIETKYGAEWNMDGEEVQALLEVLERRFS
jgi:hypothetical protein